MSDYRSEVGDAVYYYLATFVPPKMHSFVEGTKAVSRHLGSNRGKNKEHGLSGAF